MTDEADAILSLLPARLKAARKSQGLSLDAVAKLSGVSRSMVSQIERGESSPTVATLWNLTRALQVDFAGLLEDSTAPIIEVMRKDQKPTIDMRRVGCRISILSPPEDTGRFEVYELIFAAGGVLNSEPHTRGTRENLTVFEGELAITVNGTREVLATGDTAHYAADLAHRIDARVASRAFLVVKGE